MKATYIPRINLHGGLDHSIERKTAAIRSACETTGFFVITNHGIPKIIMEDCHTAATHFFSQSITQKNKICQNTRMSPYGFSPMSREILARSHG